MTSWAEVKLGDLVELRSGGTPSKQCPEYWNGDLPWVSPKDVKVMRLHSTEEAVTETSIGNGTRAVEAGTILLVVRSMILAREVPITVVQRRMAFNQDIKAICIKPCADSGFVLAWLLASRTAVLGIVDEAGHGTKRLQTDRLLAMPVALPPLTVQRRIASILGAYDDLIETNRRRIAILEEMARRLFNEWFVKFRFPGHEEHPIIASPLGDIPKGWEGRAIEELVKRIPVGRRYDQKTVKATGAVPVLDQGKSGIIGYHDEDPGVTASETAPVIAFANHTCYQRLIHFPFSAIQNVLPFVPSPSLARNIYWLHWATDGIVHLNDYKGHWPEFVAKKLLVPSADLCQRFGSFAAPLSLEALKLERASDNLRRTRDLLLPGLISGEISASEANYELEAAA